MLQRQHGLLLHIYMFRHDSDVWQLDSVPLAWAAHRLGGLQTPANAAYSAPEVAYQLVNSRAQCLFISAPQLETALQAADEAKLPRNRIFMLEIPGTPSPEGYKTVNQLIAEGSKLPKLEPLNWSQGEGARRAAFLCYSSGTSGLPVSASFRIDFLHLLIFTRKAS